MPLGYNKKPNVSQKIEMHPVHEIYNESPSAARLPCHVPYGTWFRLDPLRHQLSLVLPPTCLEYAIYFTVVKETHPGEYHNPPTAQLFRAFLFFSKNVIYLKRVMICDGPKLRKL